MENMKEIIEEAQQTVEEINNRTNKVLAYMLGISPNPFTEDEKFYFKELIEKTEKVGEKLKNIDVSQCNEIDKAEDGKYLLYYHPIYSIYFTYDKSNDHIFDFYTGGKQNAKYLFSLFKKEKSNLPQ